MIARLLVVGLTLSVTPRVVFAPASLSARIRVDTTPASRRVIVALVSDDFAQQSDVPIAPRAATQTVWMAPWVHVPAGEYVVRAVLVDDRGRVTASDTTTVHVAPGGPR